MEEKTYECNDELTAVLFKHGFKEMTKAADRIKGKKEFRKGIRSRIVITFDYINVEVFEENSGCNFGHPRITEEDLKMLLWYTNSNNADKEHISDGHFDLHRVRQNHKTMTSLLGYSKEFNHRNTESRRFERLLNNYQGISLD